MSELTDKLKKFLSSPTTGNAPMTNEFLSGVQFEKKRTERVDATLVKCVKVIKNINYGVTLPENDLQLAIRKVTDKALAELAEALDEGDV